MAPSSRRRFLAVSAAFTCGLLGGVPRSLGGEPVWVDAKQTGPFVCQATFSLAGYESLFEELPILEQELMRTLQLRPVREPINIYLFSSREEHRATIEARYPQIPYRRALYVKEGGVAGVYVYRHPELDVDLRHECTHALLHARLAVVPLWLDEGLAEYFEVPQHQRAFGHPHFNSLRWNMRLGMIRTVEALEQRKDLTEMGGFEYRYAWAWVHFMLHGPQAAHEELVKYLATIQHGNGSSQLSQQLALAVPNTTEQMVQHFKHWRQ